MSDDISLLPENLRDKEEESKKTPPPSSTGDRLKMYVPKAEEEDIEVIEVDEGEIGEVLEGEPLLTRLLFKTQAFLEEVNATLFHPRKLEPPPKLPPQFFKAPVIAPGVAKKSAPGLVPIGEHHATESVSNRAAVTEVEPKPKARVIPAAETPRRVRVIRRVRKPVRVSFLDEGSLRAQIDVPRRRFTLIVLAAVFLILLGGGYGIMSWQGDRAHANLMEVARQLNEVQATSKQRQVNWDTYRDLEPRLKALTLLLDRHLSPSKVFDALELNTLPQVYYSSFTLAPDGSLILGTTAPSFEVAARQLVAFERSGMATKVQAMGYQATYAGENGALERVAFQISLKLVPQVLQAGQSLPPPAPVATR